MRPSKENSDEVHIRKRLTNETYKSNLSKKTYGVAMISRLFKIIGLFCKRALSKRRYSAKETYHFKKPTNRSHIMCIYVFQDTYMSPFALFTKQTRPTKEPYKRDDILQKRPIILRSLLIVATPYKVNEAYKRAL